MGVWWAQLERSLFLRAFLMYNKTFKIRLFSHFIHTFHKDAFKDMPLSYKNAGGNIWIEKVE